MNRLTEVRPSAHGLGTFIAHSGPEPVPRGTVIIRDEVIWAGTTRAEGDSGDPEYPLEKVNSPFPGHPRGIDFSTPVAIDGMTKRTVRDPSDPQRVVPILTEDDMRVLFEKTPVGVSHVLTTFVNGLVQASDSCVWKLDALHAPSHRTSVDMSSSYMDMWDYPEPYVGLRYDVVFRVVSRCVQHAVETPSDSNTELRSLAGKSREDLLHLVRRRHSIIEANKFTGVALHDLYGEINCVYPYISRINHSHLPVENNACAVFLPNGHAVVVATRPLCNGEEVRIAYSSTPSFVTSVDTRLLISKNRLGFEYGETELDTKAPPGPFAPNFFLPSQLVPPPDMIMFYHPEYLANSSLETALQPSLRKARDMALLYNNVSLRARETAGGDEDLSVGIEIFSMRAVLRLASISISAAATELRSLEKKDSRQAREANIQKLLAMAQEKDVPTVLSQKYAQLASQAHRDMNAGKSYLNLKQQEELLTYRKWIVPIHSMLAHVVNDLYWAHEKVDTWDTKAPPNAVENYKALFGTVCLQAGALLYSLQKYAQARKIKLKAELVPDHKCVVLASLVGGDLVSVGNGETRKEIVTTLRGQPLFGFDMDIYNFVRTGESPAEQK